MELSALPQGCSQWLPFPDPSPSTAELREKDKRQGPCLPTRLLLPLFPSPVSPASHGARCNNRLFPNESHQRRNASYSGLFATAFSPEMQKRSSQWQAGSQKLKTLAFWNDWPTYDPSPTSLIAK
ncbi:unnamed protein product [Sphagnum jensenii]